MATMILTGRLGKDAELKSLQSGTDVLAWSMAYDTGYGDKKVSHWVKCALFGKRAASLHPMMTKGSLVEVTGEPIVSAWIDKKTSAARGQIELAVQEVKLHGGGKDRAAPDHTEPQAPKRREAQDDSDRIPF